MGGLGLGGGLAGPSGGRGGFGLSVSGGGSLSLLRGVGGLRLSLGLPRRAGGLGLPGGFGRRRRAGLGGGRLLGLLRVAGGDPRLFGLPRARRGGGGLLLMGGIGGVGLGRCLGLTCGESLSLLLMRLGRRLPRPRRVGLGLLLAGGGGGALLAGDLSLTRGVGLGLLLAAEGGGLGLVLGVGVGIAELATGRRRRQSRPIAVRRRRRTIDDGPTLATGHERGRGHGGDARRIGGAAIALLAVTFFGPLPISFELFFGIFQSSGNSNKCL